MDNSARRALLNREGLGGLKHVDLHYLWVQQKREEGAFSVKAIGTQFCPADVGTKAHNATRLKLLSYMCGLSCAGLPVGREVFVAEWNLQATKKMAASASRKSLKQNLRQVLALSLLELGWSAQNNEYPEAMDYHINDFVFDVLFIVGILFVLVKINKLVSMLFGKDYKDKKITTASSTSLWSSSLNFGVVLIYFNLLGFAFGKNDLEKTSASTSTSSWTSSTTSTWWDGEMIPFLVLFYILIALVACMPPRRWQRVTSSTESGDGEEGENLISEEDVRDRMHTWLENVFLPALLDPSLSTARTGGGDSGDGSTTRTSTSQPAASSTSSASASASTSSAAAGGKTATYTGTLHLQGAAGYGQRSTRSAWSCSSSSTPNGLHHWEPQTWESLPPRKLWHGSENEDSKAWRRSSHAGDACKDQWSSAVQAVQPRLSWLASPSPKTFERK